jgi:hypothetical protein
MAESLKHKVDQVVVPTVKPCDRLPSRNTAFSVHFVIRGAEKRRGMAYSKAKSLQRELGVIPRLTCVK